MLFKPDEVDPPEKKKRGRPPGPRPDTTGSVKACIDRFHEQFIKKFNPGVNPTTTPKEHLVTPLMSGGKHGKKFKELVASWGEAAVIEVIDRYFQTKDPQITRSDYSLDFFFFKAQYLRLAGVRRAVPDERLADNIAAASRATGRDH
jgi:hypothetical protein